MLASIKKVRAIRTQEDIVLVESAVERVTGQATPHLWIDVEDLFEYARVNARPSGIQRLAFEIYHDLQARPDIRPFIHFVRHDNVRNSFRVVQWSEIDTLYDGLAHSTSQPQPAPVASATNAPILPHSRSRQWTRRVVYRLPVSVRVHVIDILIAGSATLRAVAGLVRSLALETACWAMSRIRGAGSRVAPEAGITPRPVPKAADPSSDFAAISKAGDILLTAGSPWGHPDYARLVQNQRDRGLKFALLIYDLIPLRRPEWCNRGLVRVFAAWLEGVLPVCDHILAISRATATDVEACMAERNILPVRPVVPIPIGTGFSRRAPDLRIERERPLPKTGSYALVVSTIEARKNHLLLFRVWRRLLEEMPPADVPTLVFAGRIGWLVDDLMKQIANTAYLDGKLVVIENPTDAELETLYQGCLFTLFPSFFEGWGLPVAESLAFGKPCITSNRTSLPEVGGKLTRRFDPDNLNDAYAMIRQAIEDRPGLARWEAQVRREFRPVPWSVTVDALLSGIGFRQDADVPVETVRHLRRESRAV